MVMRVEEVLGRDIGVVLPSAVVNHRVKISK